MTINERIKKIRKSKGLNQADFGKKIGLSESAICNYENGRRDVSELTIKSICREYRINYDWLKNGIEPMEHIVDNSTLLETLKREYDLSDIDIEIMSIYITLSKEEREAFNDFIKKIKDTD